MTTFDWALIQPIGDELIQVDDEAHLRSAFDRYYYGPYCSTKYYLINLGHLEYLGPKGGHKNLYEELKKSPDFNEQKLGQDLEELFKKRVDADYLIERNGNNLDLEYFKNELSSVQSHSKQAMQLVSILKNNPPRHRFKRF
jgi:hypothetical protein